MLTMTTTTTEAKARHNRENVEYFTHRGHETYNANDRNAFQRR